MKFNIDSSKLLQILLVAGKIIAPKNTLPILDNFKLRLDNGQLMITASDMETMYTTTFTEIENADGDGEIAVPAKLILDTLKELPQQPLQIKHIPEKNVVRLEWHSGNAQIPCFDTADYPAIPKLNSFKAINIFAKDLMDGINATINSASNEELRPTMCGIDFDIDGETLTMVASNAMKMSWNTCTVGAKDGEKASFIMTKKTANFLKAALARYEGPVVISFDERNMTVRYGSDCITSRLIEGSFPKYRSIIPDTDKNENFAIIDKEEIMNSIKRVAVCSTKENPLLVCDFSTNSITIAAENKECSTNAKDTLMCNYAGEDTKIGLSATRMLELLGTLPYKNIKLSLFGANKAVVLENADIQEETTTNVTKALAMPMRMVS